MSESQQIVYKRTSSNEEGMMARSNSKDSGIDRDYSLSSSRDIDNDVRRDSTGSNDSSVSKKQASLNEIQDLYSALQDLVKTNVTATPIATRNQNFLTSTPDELKSSPRSSPKLRLDEPLRVNEHFTIIIDTKDGGKLTPRATSSTGIVQYKKDHLLRHKRGHSAGNVDAIKRKNSPLINRRSSNDSEPTNSDEDRHVTKTTRSASAIGDKMKKETKLLRNSSNKSEGKSNKRWKPKLFSRLRSKSIHGNEEGEEEQCASEGDGSFTPPLADKNRRLSEADVKKLEKKAAKNNKPSKNAANNSCPPVRKKFVLEQSKQEESTLIHAVCKDNVKDIDQLVASLNIDYSNGAETKQEAEAMKSPESELDKLSCWFEKAAAEAVQNQSNHVDQDPTKRRKSDVVDSRRKSAGKKGITVKRGNSAGRHDRRQLRKTASKNKDNHLTVNGLGSMQARSTPNLRDENYDSDTSDLDSPTCTGVTLSPNKERRNKNLAEPISRLPKTPLFYVPDTQLANQNTLQIVNPNKFFDHDVFYTENENDLSELAKTNENINIEGQHRSESKDVKQTKQTNIHEKRPKSMFTLGSYIEFKIDTKNLQTDDNANFCETTSVSPVSITPNGMVQSQKAIMT